MSIAETKSVPIDELASYVAKDPAICFGKPHLIGTRIRVQDIYLLHELQGMSVDELVLDFPALTHEQVYASLAFFWGHREEILRDIREGDQLVEAEKARQNASPVQRKLIAEKHAPNDWLLPR